MAVTLVATPGAADANSFVLLEDADAYLATRPAWVAETDDDERSRVLIEATTELTWLEYEAWRTDGIQALSWPRKFALDPDAPWAVFFTFFDPTIIPRRIKDATCELALAFLEAGATDLAFADDTIGIIREKTGPLETEWQPGTRVVGFAKYPRVIALIDPLLANGGARTNDVERA